MSRSTNKIVLLLCFTIIMFNTDIRIFQNKLYLRQSLVSNSYKINEIATVIKNVLNLSNML